MRKMRKLIKIFLVKICWVWLWDRTIFSASQFKIFDKKPAISLNPTIYSNQWFGRCYAISRRGAKLLIMKGASLAVGIGAAWEKSMGRLGTSRYQIIEQHKWGGLEVTDPVNSGREINEMSHSKWSTRKQEEDMQLRRVSGIIGKFWVWWSEDKDEIL